MTTTTATPAAVDYGSMSVEQLTKLLQEKDGKIATLSAQRPSVLNGEPVAKVKKAEQAIDPKTKKAQVNADGTPKMSGGKLSIYGVTSAQFPITCRNGVQIDRLFRPDRVLGFVEAGIRDFANFNFESQAETEEERTKEIAEQSAHTKDTLVRLRKQYQVCMKTLKDTKLL